MEKYSVYDVFTPTMPARLTFVERKSILNKITNAIKTPGKQIIVYGSSGCGKTTLLENKLHQLYESHITSRCMTGMTVNELILNAFDQLAGFYISEKTNTRKTSIKASLKQEYLVIKSAIEGTMENSDHLKEQRIIPPQLTAQGLCKFIGESNSCWVLEDFHKVDKKEKKKLSQLMKVFMDEADNYKSVKIIAIGAVDSARQIVEYDPEMRNRVAEISVPMMSDDEITEIMNKGLKCLNLTMTLSSKREITKYTNGLASVCHHLCLNACNELGLYETAETETEIKKTNLQGAVKSYLEDMSDTVKNSFENTFKQERSSKYKNAEIIINALSRCDQNGATRAEIYKSIVKRVKNYPQGNLTIFLSKLVNDNEPLILLNGNSGKYTFKDPIYRVAALLWFSEEKHRTMVKLNFPFISSGSFEKLLSEKMNELHKRLLEIKIDSKAELKHLEGKVEKKA